MPPGSEPRWHSMVEMLRWRAEAERGREMFTFLQDGEEASVRLTCGELDRRARALAAALQARRAQGERILLLFPPGLDYVVALFGCLYAGAIAVPAHPPDPARLERTLPLLRRIAQGSGSSLVLTDRRLLFFARGLEEQLPELAALDWLALEDLPAGIEERWRDPGAGGDDLALLQYTAEDATTTGGLLLSHGNLLWSLEHLRQRSALGDDAAAVHWLSPLQGLGLLAGVLLPLYHGHPVTLMAPWHFLQRPDRWLRALSRTRATHTAGTGSGLELCVRRMTPEQRARLDLTALEVVLCDGEPVRAGTLERFAAAFADRGLDPLALAPVYGPAEATSLIAASPVGVPLEIRCVEAEALRDGRVRLGRGNGPTTTRLAGCGEPGAGHRLLIVDPATCEPAQPDQVGEIWLAGPAVGRCDSPEETAQGFLATGGEEPFLRTGDLGFLDDGQLFLVGRLEDLIVLGERSYHPQDVEHTVEQAAPRLRPGCGAAFAMELEGEPRLVVVQEVEEGFDAEAVVAAVREAILRDHRLPLGRLALVRPRLLPKTPNGRIQRSLIRRLLAKGKLEAVFDRQLVPRRPQRGNGSPLDPRAVAQWIAGELGRVIGDGGHEVRLDVSLANSGLDSVHFADLIQRTEAHFGVALPLSDVPREITALELAEHIARQHDGAAAEPGPPQGKALSFADLPALQDIRRRLAAFAESAAENPYFRVNDRVAHGMVATGGRELLNFASYDYLALNGHPAVSEAAKRAVDQYGTSASASRVASGERPCHRELEAALADLLGTEDCLVFVSGNLTNVTTLGHLVGRGDLVVHDIFAHDSIVRGIELSGAARRTFPHNDWRALDRLLAAVRGQYAQTIVVIEGLYSMDGDVPDLPCFIEVKNRHGAFLMVDEAHSIGVLGRSGRGIGEQFGIDPREVEIWMGTLSKAFASCGGYIAGSSDLVELLKYSAPGFVFSVGLPPPSAGASLAAIRQMQREPERVERLKARSEQFLELAREHGLDTGHSEGWAVIPVILGSSERAVLASNRLLERGVNVQPIVHPAVEEGAARLRFFLCADHTEDQIRAAVDTVAQVVRELVAPEAPLLVQPPDGARVQP